MHQRTGTRLHTSYHPARLRWLRDTHPGIASRTAKFLSLGSTSTRGWPGSRAPQPRRRRGRACSTATPTRSTRNCWRCSASTPTGSRRSSTRTGRSPTSHRRWRRTGLRWPVRRGSGDPRRLRLQHRGGRRHSDDGCAFGGDLRGDPGAGRRHTRSTPAGAVVLFRFAISGHRRRGAQRCRPSDELAAGHPGPGHRGTDPRRSDRPRPAECSTGAAVPDRRTGDRLVATRAPRSPGCLRRRRRPTSGVASPRASPSRMPGSSNSSVGSTPTCSG